MQIRPARLGDERALAELETRVWRATYRGLLPDALLDGLSEGSKTALWRGYLRDGVTTLVLEREGQLLGLAGYGPTREPMGGFSAGEIYAIYLDGSVWGQGHGRALFERCRDALYAQGSVPLVVWVLRQNVRARRFYERQGMLLDEAEKIEHLDGVPLPQVLYWLPSLGLASK